MIMLHFGCKSRLEVAVISENAATNTFPLSDTTFIALSCCYYNPEISMLKYYVRKKSLKTDYSVDEKEKPTNFSGSCKE